MTVLDVHPVGYDTAARTFGEAIAGEIEAAVEVLLADLSGCYGMAGSDDTAQSWAPNYDDSARSATRAFTDLTNAAYRLAALLEQCAINYAGAEAACLPHETASQSQARWAHTTVAPAGTPPSAAGLSLPEPEGWSLLAHLIGRVWPNGHQDLLHHAADAWHTAAATLRDISPVLDHAVACLAAEQRAPEIDDAVTVLDRFGTTLAALAHECADLGDACDSLAHEIDQAHSRIIRECVEFMNTTIAAEAAGGVLCAVTAGLSEAAAQAVVIRAGLAAADTIRNAIDALASVAVGVAADLDAVAARLAAVSRDVVPVLGRTVEPASVVRPGLAGVVGVRAVDDPAFARLGEFADTLVPGGPAEETWANLATLERHYRSHWMQFAAESPDAYARQAALFRLRAFREHLPMKYDQAGDTLRIYDPARNVFASYRLDGMSRTIFKPKSGIEYWKRQPGVLVNG